MDNLSAPDPFREDICVQFGSSWTPGAFWRTHCRHTPGPTVSKNTPTTLSPPLSSPPLSGDVQRSPASIPSSSGHSELRPPPPSKIRRLPCKIRPRPRKIGPRLPKIGPPPPKNGLPPPCSRIERPHRPRPQPGPLLAGIDRPHLPPALSQACSSPEPSRSELVAKATAVVPLTRLCRGEGEGMHQPPGEGEGAPSAAGEKWRGAVGLWGEGCGSRRPLGEEGTGAIDTLHVL
jgi:hypothetical protein